MEHVNHPSHYQKGGKECITAMREKYGDDAVLVFCVLNTFKYEWRAGKKDGNSYDQDMEKAKWYRNYAEQLLKDINDGIELTVPVFTEEDDYTTQEGG